MDVDQRLDSLSKQSSLKREIGAGRTGSPGDCILSCLEEVLEAALACVSEQ